MVKAAIEKQQDGTIKLTITLPFATVYKVRDGIIVENTKQVTLPGFRKGKAPDKLAEQQLNPERIRENVLKQLLPQAYSEVIQENNLRPIMNPKIQVEKINEGEDWIFSALTCEMPAIDPGDYKKVVDLISLHGTVPRDTNRVLAGKAFRHMS